MWKTLCNTGGKNRHVIHKSTSVCHYMNVKTYSVICSVPTIVLSPPVSIFTCRGQVSKQKINNNDFSVPWHLSVYILILIPRNNSITEVLCIIIHCFHFSKHTHTPPFFSARGHGSSGGITPNSSEVKVVFCWHNCARMGSLSHVSKQNTCTAFFVMVFMKQSFIMHVIFFLVLFWTVTNRFTRKCQATRSWS